MSQSQPKKVLFLITKSNWGGAQRYVYDLATHLDKREFLPVVALGGTGPLLEMLTIAQIRVLPLNHLKNSTSIKTTWSAAREFYRVLRNERPAILHLNSSVAGLIGALVGRLARVPKIVFTAHGWSFNEDRPWWQRFIFKWLHYLTVLLAHETIAVSQSMVTQMNWPWAQSGMHVINPGRTVGPMFTPEEARSTLIDFFPELAPYNKDVWLGCIAELHPIKRHEVLFQAVGHLIHEHPNLRLLCIGDGIRKKELTTSVRANGLSEHIFIVGSVHEAARFLKAFDIFVLASKSESYGYVLHEAGLAGVPVVATNVGGIPDIITNGHNGLLVPKDNVKALCQALRRYLTEPDLRTSYSANLYASTSLNSIELMAKKTENIYRS